MNFHEKINRNFYGFFRGGPYWQDVIIPYSKFLNTYKGHLQDKRKGILYIFITLEGEIIDTKYFEKISSTNILFLHFWPMLKSSQKIAR